MGGVSGVLMMTEAELDLDSQPPGQILSCPSPPLPERTSANAAIPTNPGLPECPGAGAGAGLGLLPKPDRFAHGTCGASGFTQGGNSRDGLPALSGHRSELFTLLCPFIHGLSQEGPHRFLPSLPATSCSAHPKGFPPPGLWEARPACALRKPAASLQTQESGRLGSGPVV